MYRQERKRKSGCGRQAVGHICFLSECARGPFPLRLRVRNGSAIKGKHHQTERQHLHRQFERNKDSFCSLRIIARKRL